MDNYKIKVKDEAENEEIQKAFFELGYTWNGSTTIQPVSYPINGKYWISTRKVGIFNSLCWSAGHAEGKLITLPQLRDLVVLKRNDARDANVYEDAECSCLDDLYLTSDRELYFYHCGKEKWITSSLNHDDDYYATLKPIEKLQDPALISGADALRALADGKEVEYNWVGQESSKWMVISDEFEQFTLHEILSGKTEYGAIKFRLKPTTLTVNAELPKPHKETQKNTEVYAVTYEFKSHEERNAFADKLRGTNS